MVEVGAGMLRCERLRNINKMDSAQHRNNKGLVAIYFETILRMLSPAAHRTCTTYAPGAGRANASVRPAPRAITFPSIPMIRIDAFAVPGTEISIPRGTCVHTIGIARDADE
jgi:hypothetical protein